MVTMNKGRHINKMNTDVKNIDKNRTEKIKEEKEKKKERKAKARVEFNQMKKTLTNDAEKVLILKSMPYKEFLNTKYWKTIKEYIITNINNSCSLCNCDNERLLQVHHRTYDYKGEEFSHLSCLTILCNKCHQMFHENTPNFGKKDIII